MLSWSGSLETGIIAVLFSVSGCRVALACFLGSDCLASERASQAIKKASEFFIAGCPGWVVLAGLHLSGHRYPDKINQN